MARFLNTMNLMVQLIRFFTLSVLLFPVFCLGQTGPRCEAVLLDASWATLVDTAPLDPRMFTPDHRMFKNELDPQVLDRHGYALWKNAKNNHTYLIHKKTKKNLGRLLVVEAKYLFEWADKETHESLMEHGAHAEYMNEVLEMHGQASGKGFYVSLHPGDSASYGSHLTTFKTQGPLVLLEFEWSNGNSFYMNTKFVKSLSNIGIDGVRRQGYQHTWISMISSRHLENPVALPEEVFQFAVNTSIGDYSGKISSQAPSEYWAKVSENNIFKKLESQALSFREMRTLFRWTKKGWSDSLTQKVAGQLMTYGLEARRPEELQEVLELITDSHVWLDGGAIRNFRKALSLNDQKASDRERIYQGMLELFDIATVANNMTGKTQKERLSFEKMKAATMKYLAAKERVRLDKIRTLRDLMVAAEKLYGIPYEVRDYSVIMTNANSRDYHLDLSKDIYDLLQANPYLTLSENMTRNSDMHKVMVEYFNIKKVPNMLLPTLDKLPLSKVKDLHEDSPPVKKLTREVLTRIMDSMMKDEAVRSVDGRSAVNPEQLYLAFVSLHGFKDGNGRIARLFYQVMNQRRRGEPLAIDLVNYDLDLFAGNQQEADMFVGAYLKFWVRQAKDDREFVSRCYWAFKLHNKIFPEYQGL